MKKLNLTSERFGRLVVLGETGEKKMVFMFGNVNVIAAKKEMLRVMS